MLNSETIAGIIFLVLCGIVFVMAPYYWCVIGSKTGSTFICCLPTILMGIFLPIGVLLVVFGQENEHNRLRH